MCVACRGSHLLVMSVVNSDYVVSSVTSCKWPFYAGIASFAYKTFVGCGS